MTPGHLAELVRQFTDGVNQLSDRQLARTVKMPEGRQSVIELVRVLGQGLDEIKEVVPQLEAAKSRLERALGPGRLMA